MTDIKQKGVVAAGHRLTAETAAAVLRDGGNAADAAIAALAMACVCEPVLASPGGGGFAMLRDAQTGNSVLIDFFPQTPQEHRMTGSAGVIEVHADFGTATQMFHIGPATVAAPGFFAGIESIRERGAGASLSDLFAPAANAARTGVRVTPYQHFLSNVVQSILTATPAARDLFAPGGQMVAAGELYRNPGLADALEIMAADGFANSAVGQMFAEGQNGRGHLGVKDLADYRAVVRDPIMIGCADCRISLNPLPAASGVLIAHGLGHLADTRPVSMADAMNCTDLARRRANGDMASLLDRPVRQRGTTHVSIIDSAGNACAVTVSNGEGNGELVGPFGFMPNNILGEEDVNPHGAGGWPANTRLASMMCPAIIETGDGGIAALGSGGSNRIRSAMLQVISRISLDGSALTDAVEAPRMHVENGHLDFEDQFSSDDRTTLTNAFPDHRAWPKPNMFFGGVHAVSMCADGRFDGAGDRRRDGICIIVE
ncbi:MAG: gamma-glutamyltransferase [Rhizobiaceae bacterium]